MPSTPVTSGSLQQARSIRTDGCDLCRSRDAVVVAEGSSESSPLVICTQCRLIYSWPPLSTTALDNFYEDIFANDPGSIQRAGSAFPPDDDRRKEEILAEHWGIKIIKRFIDPRGKKILDLRARTGAMTAILQTTGAEVLGVEPFQANANYARQVRGLANVFDLPFSRFHEFPLPQNGQFDIVNALNHHALAHVLSPRVLLEHIFTVLTPGGYLFLDEKDVLHPVRHKKRSALDSGPAHQFQLTVHTTARYIRATGFELLECELDPHRSSDFRHIRIVARKPQEGEPSPGFSPRMDVEKGPSLQAIQRRLWWLERTWQVRLARIRLKKNLSDGSNGWACNAPHKDNAGQSFTRRRILDQSTFSLAFPIEKTGSSLVHYEPCPGSFDGACEKSAFRPKRAIFLPLPIKQDFSLWSK